MVDEVHPDLSMDAAKKLCKKLGLEKEPIEINVDGKKRIFLDCLQEIHRLNQKGEDGGLTHAGVYKLIISKNFQKFCLKSEVDAYKNNKKLKPKHVTPFGLFIICAKWQNQMSRLFFDWSKSNLDLSRPRKRKKKKIEPFSKPTMDDKMARIKSTIREELDLTDENTANQFYDKIINIKELQNVKKKKNKDLSTFTKTEKEDLLKEIFDFLFDQLDIKFTAHLQTECDLSGRKTDKLADLFNAKANEWKRKIEEKFQINCQQLKFIYKRAAVRKFKKNWLEKYGIKIQEATLDVEINISKLSDSPLRFPVKRNLSFIDPKTIVSVMLKTLNFPSTNLGFLEDLNCKKSKIYNFEEAKEFFEVTKKILQLEIELQITYDALNTFKYSKRKIKNHSHISIKIGNVILDIVFHEGKEQWEFLEYLKIYHFFDLFNDLEKEYLFVGHILFKLKIVLVNDIPGHCCCLGVEWKKDWDKGKLPTYIVVEYLKDNGQIGQKWVDRFDLQSVEANNWEELLLILKSNHFQVKDPYFDPRRCDVKFCPGHLGESCGSILLKFSTNEMFRVYGMPMVLKFAKLCYEKNIPFQPTKFLKDPSRYKNFVGFLFHKSIQKNKAEIEEMLIGTALEGHIEKFITLGIVNNCTPLDDETVRKFDRELKENPNFLQLLEEQDPTSTKAYFIIFRKHFLPRWNIEHDFAKNSTKDSETMGYDIRFVLGKRCNHNPKTHDQNGKRTKLAVTQVLEFFILKFLLENEQSIEAFDKETLKLRETLIVDLNNEQFNGEDSQTQNLWGNEDNGFIVQHSGVSLEDQFNQMIDEDDEEEFADYADFLKSNRAKNLDDMWNQFEEEILTGEKRKREIDE